MRNIFWYTIGALAALLMALAIYTTAYHRGVQHALHDSTITTDGIHAYIDLDGTTRAYYLD